MNEANKAKYLGNNLQQDCDIDKEIAARIVETMITYNRLTKVFRLNKNDQDRRWKIIVFNAVIISKLLYGLENIALNTSHNKKLDAFQMRQLRKILNWHPTFIDRTKTNEKAIAEINRIIQQNTKRHSQPFTPISKILMKQRVKLLAHIIRTDPEDPIKLISFKPNSIEHNVPDKRRVGRPKLNWIFETKKYIFENYIANNVPYLARQVQDELIINLAINRTI